MVYYKNYDLLYKQTIFFSFRLDVGPCIVFIDLSSYKNTCDNYPLELFSILFTKFHECLSMISIEFEDRIFFTDFMRCSPALVFYNSDQKKRSLLLPRIFAMNNKKNFSTIFTIF